MTSPTNSLLPPVPLEDDLLPRQRAFVNHPLADIDPVGAAKAVGYSDNYASNRGHMLRKELLYFIRQKSNQVAAWTNVDAMATLHQLGAIAASDIMDYFEYVDTDGGSRLQLKENLKALPSRMRAAIKKIEFETVLLTDATGSSTAYTVVSKLELHDKIAALKELVAIHRLTETPPEERKDSLRGMTVEQLQELEDTMVAATSRIRLQNRAAREKEAIDVMPSK